MFIRESDRPLCMVVTDGSNIIDEGSKSQVISEYAGGEEACGGKDE